MAHQFYEFTYEGDEDPMFTNLMDSITSSVQHTLPGLPDEDLVETAIDDDEYPEALVEYSPLSPRTSVIFEPFGWKPPVTRIPTELLIQVAEYLPRADLLDFAGSCRRFRDASIPVVWGTVDLSIHNRGRVAYGPFADDEFHRHYSSSFRCRDVPSKAFARQERFLDQIRKNPDYARYVKQLSWTLLLLQEPEWDQGGHRYPLLGNDEDGNPIDRPILHIWEVFETLTNVKTLDLAYLSHDHGHPLASAFPDALFPGASEIRLSGVMDYALAASILAPPAKLKHLDWDNVQQPANPNFLYRQTNPRQPYHQQVLAPWNNIAAYNESATDYFNAPGPMHNLIGSLTGRCPNLTSLLLSKTAERGPRHTRETSEYTHAYSCQDEDLYAEWAHFLTGQRSVLERLTLEQGQRDFLLRTRHLPQPLGAPAAMNLERMMDERFENMIFWPVIMQGAWPRLMGLGILGVRTWSGRRNFSGWVQRRVWHRFGRGFAVLVEAEGIVFDHIGMDVHG